MTTPAPRLWMVDPKILCSQHLLGEHDATHALGKLDPGEIKALVRAGLVHVPSVEPRHDALVAEMARRGFPGGFGHKTPWKGILPAKGPSGFVDVDRSYRDLDLSCPGCRARHLAFFEGRLRVA